MHQTLTASQVASATLAAFESECRELGLDARLELRGDVLEPTFAGQFGASPAWLSQVFGEELRARALDAQPGWTTEPATELELEPQLAAVRLALRRTRARLVDADSWVSGGMEWPFPVSDPVLRERGIATYRAPARAPTVVTAERGSVTIAFPAGDCGEVYSAGIWVPTALAGDFDVAVSYRLPEWIAGERPACLGLFAVAADGSFRMYAQRVTHANEPARVVADIEGAAGPTTAPCSGPAGRLRIARDRGLLSAWHRDAETWSWLGRFRERAPRALLLGIKIWASGRSGPLRAELTDFELIGSAAGEQTPPPPVRPDPRQSA